MLNKKIQLFASVESFRFTDGSKDYAFDTKLFINPEGLIAGVGSRPYGDATCEEVEVFGSSCTTERLSAAIHFGLQKFSGRLRILPGYLHVFVSPDLAQLLDGSEKAVFERAGSEACASNVLVSLLSTADSMNNEEAEQ